MRVFECVVGVGLILVAGMGAIQQLVILAQRYRGAGVWQLVSVPAARRFRISLLVMAQGVLVLQTGSSARELAAAALWTAILAWHCVIWLRARLQRGRPRTAA
jgi:hypothetical protein